MIPGIQPLASDVVAIAHSIMAGSSVLAELSPFPDCRLCSGVIGVSIVLCAVASPVVPGSSAADSLAAGEQEGALSG